MRQGARQKDALLLPAGKLADLPVGEIGHADAVETGQGLLAMPPAGKAQQPDLGIEPHDHHIDDPGGEVPINARALRHVGDPAARLGNRPAEDADLAGHRRNVAQRALQQGRLARTVGPDDRGHGGGGHVGVDGKDRRLPAVRDRQAADGQRVLRGRRRFDDPAGVGDQFRACRDRSGHEPAPKRPCMPSSGASPPNARAIDVTLWSIMPI